MQESEFHYLFTFKNAHLSSIQCNQILQGNLHIWPESSYVNTVNMVKNCYNSGDNKFFLGDYVFGTPCI